MEKYQFNYQVYASMDALDSQDKTLFTQAINKLKDAYAPYSKFKVAAAILLENGAVVLGTNQENAAYPSGLCAERTAIFYASSQYPLIPIEKIVVVAESEEILTKAIPPCGACRQSIYEYEYRQEKPIQIIFGTNNSSIFKINSIKDLLPFSFNSTLLNS